MPSSTIAGLLAVPSIASIARAGNIFPPVQSSNRFALYPFVTSGVLTGPYTANNINLTQAIQGWSGYEDDTYETDCFNRIIFSTYNGGTHCYDQDYDPIDQCGAERWSLHDTYLDNLRIAPASQADLTGRRDVGWVGSSSNCETSATTPGFHIEGGNILHLKYENEESHEEFGTFMACEGGLYGPRLYYRRAEGTTPEGCAEVLLVPRCTAADEGDEKSTSVQCYQGGIPGQTPEY